MNLESQTTIHTHIHRVCEPYSAQNKNVWRKPAQTKKDSKLKKKSVSKDQGSNL